MARQHGRHVRVPCSAHLCRRAATSPIHGLHRHGAATVARVGVIHIHPSAKHLMPPSSFEGSRRRGGPLCTLGSGFQFNSLNIVFLIFEPSRLPCKTAAASCTYGTLLYVREGLSLCVCSLARARPCCAHALSPLLGLLGVLTPDACVPRCVSYTQDDMCQINHMGMSVARCA